VPLGGVAFGRSDEQGAIDVSLCIQAHLRLLHVVQACAVVMLIPGNRLNATEILSALNPFRDRAIRRRRGRAQFVLPLSRSDPILPPGAEAIGPGKRIGTLSIGERRRGAGKEQRFARAFRVIGGTA
jgi:hypothetical protein